MLRWKHRITTHFREVARAYLSVSAVSGRDSFFPVGFGCISSEVDPRCTITCPAEYQPTVAQCVNASEFWQAYFDEIEKTTAGPLIDFKLEMEREVTGKSRGDYAPGWVNVRLSVKNLRNRRLIYEREAEVRLDDVIFVRFSADATREEIQRKAFEATEKKIFPHLEIWVNVAALRAMGQERASAEAFVPLLQEAAANPWGEDIPDAASTALNRLQAATTR